MTRLKERRCPSGCGDVQPRRAHELCATCRRDLALGREVRKETAEQRAKQDLLWVGLGEWFAYETRAYGAHPSPTWKGKRVDAPLC